MATTWVFLLLAIGGALAALDCKSDSSAGFDACTVVCSDTEKVTRTLTCTDESSADKAVFLWTYVNFTTADPFTLAFSYTNATDTYQINNGAITSPFNAAVSVIAQKTVGIFGSEKRNEAFNFDLNGLQCTPTAFTATGLTLSWTDPTGSAGKLVHKVTDDKGAAVPGTLTGSTFALTPQCSKTPVNYQVQTSLASPALDCLVPATGVTLAPYVPITAITNLAVLSPSASTSKSAASLSLNASWTAPTLSGCTPKYNVRIYNNAGFNESVLNVPVATQGSTVVISSLLSFTNPNFGNGVFFFEVYASTDVGDSPVASTTFTVDPCASSCPASGKTCSFSCTCELPPNVTYVLTREYVCEEPSLIPAFFGSEIMNLTAGTANVTNVFSNATGVHFTDNTVTAPKVFPVVGGILNGSAVLFTFTPSLVAYSNYFWIRAKTFGCKVTLRNPSALVLAWDVPAGSDGLVYSVWQDGKVVAGPSDMVNYTATPDCNVVGGKANFSVLSTLGWGVNLPCAEPSAPLEVTINPAPSAPTGIQFAGIASTMTETTAQLRFNLSWAKDANIVCPATFSALITVPGTPFSSEIPLTVQSDATTTSVVGGVTLDNFAFSSKSVDVIVKVKTEAGSASSAAASFTTPDLCASTCPTAFDPATTGCHVKCSCRGPSFASFGVERSYNCGSIFGGAGFFWSQVTLANSATQLLLNYSTPTGTSSIFNDTLTANKFFDPQALLLTGTTAVINATTLGENASKVIDFESHAVGCIATLAQTGPLTINWTSPAHSDNYLTYVLIKDGKVVGPVAGTTFTADPVCNGKANFTVQSSLKGFNLTCPSTSNTLDLELSFLPSPVTGLTVTDSKSADTNLTIHPRWTAPASLGYCELTHFQLTVTSDHGFLGTVFLTKDQVTTDDKGITTVPNGVFYNASSALNVNAVYTLTITVVTPKGSSPVESESFYLPGFLCRDTCALEGDFGESCNVNCVCHYPSDASVYVNRTYTCAVGNQSGFFFVNTVKNFDAPEGNFTASYAQASSQIVPVVNTVGAVAFNVTDKMAYSKIVLSLRPSNASTNNANLTFQSVTIPCVVTAQADPATLRLTWTAPGAAGPYLSYRVLADGKDAEGTYADDKLSFTATPKCNTMANLTVLSTLAGAGLDCHEASSQFHLRLGNLPSAVKDLTVVAPTLDVNSTSVISTLNFNLSFTPSADLWGCETVNYFLTVNASNTIIYSGPVPAPAISNVTVASVVNVELANTTLDSNAVYTVVVVARTLVGDSDGASTTFTFPSGSSSSSSGLSNTVIAGIAVGATIGVVAIALVVYKCMSSRREYEPIGGSSNV